MVTDIRSAYETADIGPGCTIVIAVPELFIRSQPRGEGCIYRQAVTVGSNEITCCVGIFVNPLYADRIHRRIDHHRHIRCGCIASNIGFAHCRGIGSIIQRDCRSH